MSSHTKYLHEAAQPIFTVDICIVNRQKVLMFKRSTSRKVFPGWWMLPGGHIEENEDPLTAAIREVKEETGVTLTSKEVRLKFVAMHHHTDRKEIYIVFGFLAIVDGNPIQPESNTEGTAQWIDIDRVKSLDNIFPPLRYYLDHILQNTPGILYNNSIWNKSELVKVVSEQIDQNN